MNKKRRRFGDRKDGRRVRTLNPMATVIPFIMKTRNDSLNMMSDTVDATVIQKYVNEKKKEGLLAGGLRCWREHGFVYTVKLLGSKIKNRFK